MVNSAASSFQSSGASAASLAGLQAAIAAAFSSFSVDSLPLLSYLSTFLLDLPPALFGLLTQTDIFALLGSTVQANGAAYVGEGGDGLEKQVRARSSEASACERSERVRAKRARRKTMFVRGANEASTKKDEKDGVRPRQ
jgi:hypothetical protein